MSTFLYLFTAITLTNAAPPTTLFPTPINGSIIPITGATGFQLCTKLNLAGCGTNTLNPFIRSYVNNEIQTLGYNYSLPFDPCDFNTINMSWILSLADLALLSLVTADQVINEMPCELYIQMPNDFLSDRDISNIITDSYWFGPTGQCIYNHTNILDCSNPNRSTINYTETQLDCFYPFVKSNYKTPIIELYEAGFEYCGVSCDFVPYNGDINKLDDFNYASSIISLIFGICFFVNVSFEMRRAYKGKNKFRELPLTFDIPITISIWMLILTMILGIASWKGKKYFACEIGTNALAENLQRDNTNCYIAGQFTMLSISSIYFYCSLLAFAIWRSLANPFNPLFGIHKIWYHIVVNIVVLGYYIGAMSEDIFAGNPVTGICGPNVIGDKGVKYLFMPLVFDIITFGIFTGLSIYKLWLHFQNQQKHSPAEKRIAHLAIRMVIYSAFMGVSLICFLYMSGRFVTDGNEWSDNMSSNINCLVENELFNSNNECILDLPIEDDVYWMQGLVVLLVSVASFVLSCSNQRYTDYSKMKKKTKETVESTIKKIKSSMSIQHSTGISTDEGSNTKGKNNSKKSASIVNNSNISNNSNNNNNNDDDDIVSIVSDTHAYTIGTLNDKNDDDNDVEMTAVDIDNDNNENNNENNQNAFI